MLKPYEWIETTVVSLKGEEKSRQMNRCYHGADGQVQKVPVTAPPAEEKKRGLRGKIAESKKEEMSDYMKQAVAPGQAVRAAGSARIQAAKDPGNCPSRRGRTSGAADLRDYAKAGRQPGPRSWIWRATDRSRPRCPPTWTRRRRGDARTCASARSTTTRPTPPLRCWRRRRRSSRWTSRTAATAERPTESSVLGATVE